MRTRKTPQEQFEAAAAKAIALDTANLHPTATVNATPTAAPIEHTDPVSQQNQWPASHRDVTYDSHIPDPSAQLPAKPLTKQQSKKELKRAIVGSESILVQASTVPVLTLFPDTFSLDRAKLTITKRWFFRMAQVTSLRIEDILSVTSTVGPFFGSVRIVARVMNNQKPLEIGPFWRDDAERMKRITHGYVIALQRQIDVSALSTSELARLLDELGQDERS